MYDQLGDSRESLLRKFRSRNRILILILILGTIFLLSLILFLLLTATSNPSIAPTVSVSPLGRFNYSAVSSDAYPCSDIGNYLMFVRGASVVDAAIATLLCGGITNMHSMGIGGGSLMMIYNRTDRSVHALDFREVAPLSATRDMFVGIENSTTGPLSIAVPGEIAGYYEAWSRFGTLPWKELFQPTIDLLEKGYRVRRSLAEAIKSKLPQILAAPNLRKLFYNEATRQPLGEGDILRNPTLANTLTKIAENASSFYNGSLAGMIVKEIQEAGGIVSAEDLSRYQPVWRPPIQVNLTFPMSLTLHGLPPPSSGALVAFALNIIGGFKFEKGVLEKTDSAVLFYHRLVETFKFVYAKRSALGDASYVNVSQLLQNLTSESFAQEIRKKINDDKTYGINYYGPSFEWPSDSGTSHLSVVGSNGDAVSVTSTINSKFGSLIMGDSTGILYNNEMDDFSTPNKSNTYDLPPSPTNFIEPGKRPMSSMSPIILTDNEGNVRFVVGGSGGSAITSGVAMVTAIHLLLGKNPKEAIDNPRLHHQLLPNVIEVERNFPQTVLDKLKLKGHEVKFEGDPPLNVVQGINCYSENGHSFVEANADYRKYGKVSGF